MSLVFFIGGRKTKQCQFDKYQQLHTKLAICWFDVLVRNAGH